MPIKYCRSCGAKNSYSYSLPEKCESCDASFGGLPKAPTRASVPGSGHRQPERSRDSGPSEMDIQEAAAGIKVNVVDVGDDVKVFKLQDIVGSNLRKK